MNGLADGEGARSEPLSGSPVSPATHLPGALSGHSLNRPLVSLCSHLLAVPRQGLLGVLSKAQLAGRQIATVPC